MHAMYEKKLALQAESYIQLKIAYEELSQVNRRKDSIVDPVLVCGVPCARKLP